MDINDIEKKISNVDFFIPAAESLEMAEKAYKAIHNFNKLYNPSNERIYRIKYKHNGKDYDEEVGKPSKVNKEIVIAIFNCDNMFIVCTGSRGVVRDEPIMAEKPYLIEYFVQD